MAVGHSDYRDNTVTWGMTQIQGGLLDFQSQALNTALQGFSFFFFLTQCLHSFLSVITHGAILIISVLFKTPLPPALSQSADVPASTALGSANVHASFWAPKHLEHATPPGLPKHSVFTSFDTIL